MSEKLWAAHIKQNKHISENIALMEQADQVDEAQALQLLILNQANLIAIHAHLQAMAARKRVEWNTFITIWVLVALVVIISIFR